MNKKESFKVVSLFSGCGGMDLGFKQAGFKILWANDFFSDAVNTYKLNIDKNIILGDITKIPSSEIPDDADVIIGGFPCQGFSIANNGRSMKDERNFLYKELLRIVKDKNPKFFVAENVKGLLSMEKGKVIEMIVKDFEDLGYKVDYKLINTAEYGIPQMRERVIIMGNRIDVENKFPQKTHYIDTPIKGLKKCPTVCDILKDLESVPISKNVIVLPDGTKIYNHNASTNVKDKFWARKYDVNQIKLCDYLKTYRTKSGLSTKKIAELLSEPLTQVSHYFRNDNNSGSIPSADTWWKLKSILSLDDTYDESVTTYEEREILFEQSLRITNWDRPSDTITATGPEIHINKMRRLSVREAARIQTFPDNFIFTGSNISVMYKQVGNAVPVAFAKLIAKEIKKNLKNEEGINE